MTQMLRTLRTSGLYPATPLRSSYILGSSLKPTIYVTSAGRAVGPKGLKSGFHACGSKERFSHHWGIEQSVAYCHADGSQDRRLACVRMPGNVITSVLLMNTPYETHLATI